MKKIWLSLLVLFGFMNSLYAADIDVSDIDKNAKSGTSKSIMFRQGIKEEIENMKRTQEQARAQAEAEAKARAEQEAKMRQQQLFKPYNIFGQGWKIAATINGDMVSNKDLQERANLFSLTTGIQVNGQNKKMVADKVMQNMIDEKVKLQEAQKQNVFVSEEEIREAYRNFERANGIPAGRFKSVLKEYQVSQEVFLSQIKANLLWTKLVSRRMGNNVDVSSREVEDEFMRIKKDMDTPKYMVSEIVIKRKDAEHIGELVEILQKDTRFELYAAQFSQAASAPSGGKLGWVSPGQLAAPLDNAIKNLKEGQVSKAVLYRNEYYIFKMDKIYNPKKDKRDMPTEDEVRNFIKNRKADEFANKYIRDLRNRAVVEKKF